jgi:aminopeptidase-like protein
VNTSPHRQWSLASPEQEGRALHALAGELFPLPRSITGEGLRATLRRLGRGLPLQIHEVPTGTPILDWSAPQEWLCREAWIRGPDGRKVVDYARSNLHVVGYSVPVRVRLDRAELDAHLHSIPAQPDAVPWRTSYYRPTWGFCLPHRLREALPAGSYEVCIDSELFDGSLSYGEIVLPGRREEEILLSAHACHPSLANDNLSGLVVLRRLVEMLADRPRRFTWRFLFAPGTVGAIAWIARNREILPRIRSVLVVAGVGDPGPFTYKRSREGGAEVDRILLRVLREAGVEHRIEDFSPVGYDERQYGSPGVGLAAGRLSRTPWGTYPQYHTSADDLDFITPEALAESLEILLRVVGTVEQGIYHRNLKPAGEPQLGRRGLYQALGGHRDRSRREEAMLWLLNLGDGLHSLADVSEASGLDAALLQETARLLEEKGLLVRED